MQTGEWLWKLPQLFLSKRGFTKLKNHNTAAGSSVAFPNDTQTPLDLPPQPLPPPDLHGAAGGVLSAWAFYKNYFPGGTRACLMPGRLKSFAWGTQAVHVWDPPLVLWGWWVHRGHWTSEETRKLVRKATSPWHDGFHSPPTWHMDIFQIPENNNGKCLCDSK